MVKTVSAVQQAPVPDAGAEEPRPRRRKLLVVGLAVVVVLAVVGGWLATRDSGVEDHEPAEGAIVEVAQLTANVAGSGLHYARVGFAVVLVEGVDAASVEPRFPLLRDAALSELGTFTAEQLRTPEGVADLRTRLSANAREVYPDGEVLRVVLTELLVQ